ncbi:MAG: hypothetical protein QY304_02090 [Candidatus Paceibacterota bacterium]|nr:MAG: hypothetical protein QY304_02090 [Candidatus Paceibacterota bacterium]
MFTKRDLTDHIVKKSDGFRGYLEFMEFVWEKEDVYTILAELSRYILKLYKEKKEEELKTIFKLIDNIFKDGDRYVKEAITIGLLETLQNNISWEKDANPEEFLIYLSDNLKNEWNNVINFWNND